MIHFQTNSVGTIFGIAVGMLLSLRFGILGLFIEPIGVVTVFVLFFTVIRGRADRADIDTFLFLTIGCFIHLFTQLYQ